MKTISSSTRYDVNQDRLAPIVLSDLVVCYATEIKRSQKAASYDLWALFSEISHQAQTLDFLITGAWWAGTVAQPLVARRKFQLTADSLADYFKCRALLPDFAEHVICSTDRENSVPVSDAAIGFDVRKLWQLMSALDWYLPKFLCHEPEWTSAKRPESELPTGQRLSTTQRFNRGLLEIAANAAMREKNDPFCVVAAELSNPMPPNTLANKLLYLADRAMIEGFPSRNTIKELI